MAKIMASFFRLANDSQSHRVGPSVNACQRSVGHGKYARTKASSLRRARQVTCGRVGCACSLPISERFVLWALRQWHQDRALPSEGSALHQGFKMAGLLDALPDFAIAMDASCSGHGGAIEIHQPACSSVSRDEATLVALCGLAQGDCRCPLAGFARHHDGADRLAGGGHPLKTFAGALAGAGLQLGPPLGAAAGKLN